MTPREHWLATTWPFVRSQLPNPPATVLEIGCGSAGGFVPDLVRAGYRATGIDPEAPDGPNYHRVEFERDDLEGPVDVIVACTSLHHVSDLDRVTDMIAAALTPAGTLVVVEWGWELMDERTAQWAFARLAEAESDAHPGWLQGTRDHWMESGLPWTDFCTQWASEHGMHAGREVLAALQARFDTRSYAEVPYFFPELADVTEAMEQAAIDAGEICAAGSHYVGDSRGLSRR
ncbi:MAG: class I SAM-dependent methyltransferase [Actinomycetota bacterium]|nr:class I SAM-dependent methyltransferase [Actinomycetota bacterium]